MMTSGSATAGLKVGSKGPQVGISDLGAAPPAGYLAEQAPVRALDSAVGGLSRNLQCSRERHKTLI